LQTLTLYCTEKLEPKKEPQSYYNIAVEFIVGTCVIFFSLLQLLLCGCQYVRLGSYRVTYPSKITPLQLRNKVYLHE